MGFAGNITADGVSLQRGATTDELDASYIQAAIEATRDHIGPVPGSGDILGVAEIGADVFAWRNNAGGTAAVMYKSSSLGWGVVDLGHSIRFDSGSSFPDSFDSGFDSGFSYADALVEGDTLFGKTSGATCVVDYYRFISGSLDVGDAVADVFFKDHEGTFIVGEQIVALRPATNGIGTIAIANTDIEFPSGGHYETVNHNFYGHTFSKRMYGINGVGNGFSYDPSCGCVKSIFTGMTIDTPNHLAAHRGRLWFSFSGGSIQYSSAIDPLLFSAILGAGEIGIGDECTGFMPTPGATLAIYAQNLTKVLYGSSDADWDLKEHSNESGCVEWSLQRMGSPMYLDDRGITTLQAVQSYGDFQDNVISDLIQPFLETRMDNVTASIRVKDKNQYRLFFDDNTAIYMTMKNRKVLGSTVIDLGKKVVCTANGVDSAGREALYFGSTDGYVYKMDSGTSFDGSTLEAVGRLPYYHYGTPEIEKRFLRLTTELDVLQHHG